MGFILFNENENEDYWKTINEFKMLPSFSCFPFFLPVDIGGSDRNPRYITYTKIRFKYFQ